MRIKKAVFTACSLYKKYKKTEERKSLFRFLYNAIPFSELRKKTTR